MIPILIAMLKKKRERGLEVGFSAVELQRIVMTLDDVLKELCKGSHAVGWRVGEVGPIMTDLKKLVEDTKEAEKRASAFEVFIQKEEEEMKRKRERETKGRKGK